MHELCRRYIAGFSEARFEVVAIRAVRGKEHYVVFYLADKDNASTTITPGRFPVKKFKVQVDSLLPLYEAIEHFNFTLENPDYNMDDMEVTNR